MYRTYVLHVCLSEVRYLRFARLEEFGERVRVGDDGLLQEAVEEQPAGLGVSPVEPEGVFVPVVGQLVFLDAVVQGADEPAFEQ